MYYTYSHMSATALSIAVILCKDCIPVAPPRKSEINAES